MRRLLIFVSALVVATQAFAVVPQFWRVQSAEDFLGGELEGFAVTSRGELRVAPAMHKVASFNDPFVLSQTTAANGDRYFGTGNDGKVYRLRGDDLKLVFTAPEPEIYAIAYRDGALLVGSSPNGKVYRVDPDSGKQTTFFDPQQAYIWALQVLSDGDLAVATGVEGKLFRVNAKGEGKVLYDATDTHIRSLAERKNGTILAGASGKGRIYEIAKDGSAHALFDSPLNEIASIYVDADDVAWAAAVSNTLPASAPTKPAKGQQQNQQQQQQQQQSGDTKKEGEPAAASTGVDVTFSFDDSAASAASQSGSSEVYRIHTDGFVETVRKFEREMVYVLSAGERIGNTTGVLLGTGPNGRVYDLRDGELSLLGAVPEKQVVSIAGNIVTTTNTGAVYRMETRATAHPEFRSAAKDGERFSRFGSYRIEGRNLDNGTVAISFRTGNTRTPDATWSAWTMPQTALEGNIAAPSAQFIQWKVTVPKPAPDAAIDGVTVAYINRNVAPEIDAIAVQDPAVVFVSSAYPSAPQVVEATNPDEYGIFTSLDTPRDHNTADPGKRMFRKGYRTVTWRASDDNGDTLHYSLAFREKGSDTWLRLRENMDETQLNFDTSQLPDGRYELRLTATDGTENPDAPLTDVKEGLEFQVDNSAPKITVTQNGGDIMIHITDDLSPVGKVEYSADAQQWNRLTPLDGISDSRDETFKLDRKAVNGKYVIIRAVDAFYNVATTSVSAN